MKREIINITKIVFVCLSLVAFSNVSLSKTKVRIIQDTNLIRVTGTVTDSSTNQIVKAKVFYEKLPYYDDMGISSTDPKNGTYELYMIENTKYIMNVKADGYEPISKEITIVDSGAGLIEKNFKMIPNETNDIIILENLIFARGNDEISEVSHQELDEFAEWLELRPSAIIQLEGHTDFQGNAEANMALSENRVLAVKDYLVKKGVKKSRIQTKAFGGTQPLSRERTPEARVKNRRVEVRILQE